MSTLPTPRLAVAPRFHLEAAWPARLRLGSRLEWLGNALVPRGPWRPPTDPELAALTGGEPHAQLLTLPQHLAERWWGLLERQHEAGGGPLAGFDDFSRAVCEFLAFKQVPVPDGAVCDLLVSAPGQAAVRWDGETGVSLAGNVSPGQAWPPVGPAPLGPRLVVNLGEEPAAVLLAGPPPGRAGDAPRPFGEIARATLASGEAVPVQVGLAPGEGVLLAPGLLVGGCTEGRAEPDVLFALRDPAS